jgi:hypothetical protein
MSRLLELDAYLTGELPDGAAADALEEAMFADPDDPDVVFFDVLARLGLTLAEHKTFHMGVTRSELDELIARGDKIHISESGAPNLPASATLNDRVVPKRMTVSKSADRTLSRLEAGLVGHDRVDIEFVLFDHDNISKVIRDAVVDPKDGSIYGLCERPLAMLGFSAGPVRTRILRRDGAKEVLAQWDFLGQLVP